MKANFVTAFVTNYTTKLLFLVPRKLYAVPEGCFLSISNIYFTHSNSCNHIANFGLQAYDVTQIEISYLIVFFASSVDPIVIIMYGKNLSNFAEVFGSHARDKYKVEVLPANWKAFQDLQTLAKGNP